MKVIAQATYVVEVELDIPDGLSDDDARTAATEAMDKVEDDVLCEKMEWSDTVFMTPNGEFAPPDAQWFDVG